MIFEISEEFEAFNEVELAPYIPALSHLCDAYLNGWHTLVMPRNLAMALGDFNDLSERHRQVMIHFLAERFPVLAGQARSSEIVLLCVPDSYQGLPAHQNQILVRLSVFNDLANCQKSALIVENGLVDGLYLSSVAEKVGIENGLGGVLALDIVHGGGTSTPAIFEQYCDRDRPAFCVVDSDKKCPASNFGYIAETITQIGVNCDKGQIGYEILPVRMIENAVPLSFFLDVFDGNAEVNQRISRYVHITNRDDYLSLGCPILDYLDLKVGENIRHINVRPQPYRDKVRLIGEAISGEPINLMEEGDTLAFPGIARDAMSNLLSFLGSQPWRWTDFLQKLKAMPAWQPLERIVRLIIAYGANSGRLPV